MSSDFANQNVATDDLRMLLDLLPEHFRREVAKLPGDPADLMEIVCDLGRLPEARFPERCYPLGDRVTSREDIDLVTSRLGTFGSDNRAGIERTLHRISAIRNRVGTIIGLTCRIGRAVYGTVEVIKDVVKSHKSILLLGRPGVGKTTLLRRSPECWPTKSRGGW